MPKIYFNGVLYNSGNVGDFMTRVNPTGSGNFIMYRGENYGEEKNYLIGNYYSTTVVPPSVYTVGYGNSSIYGNFIYKTDFLWEEDETQNPYLQNSVVFDCDFLRDPRIGFYQNILAKTSFSFMNDDNKEARLSNFSYNTIIGSSQYIEINNNKPYSVQYHQIYSTTMIGYNNRLQTSCGYGSIFGANNTLSSNGNSSYPYYPLIIGTYNTMHTCTSTSPFGSIFGYNNQIIPHNGSYDDDTDYVGVYDNYLIGSYNNFRYGKNEARMCRCYAVGDSNYVYQGGYSYAIGYGNYLGFEGKDDYCSNFNAMIIGHMNRAEAVDDGIVAGYQNYAKRYYDADCSGEYVSLPSIFGVCNHVNYDDSTVLGYYNSLRSDYGNERIAYVTVVGADNVLVNNQQWDEPQIYVDGVEPSEDIPDFDATAVYKINQVVKYNDHYYAAKFHYTPGAFDANYFYEDEYAWDTSEYVPFDSTVSYNYGDKVEYNGTYYRAQYYYAAGAFDSDCFEEIYEEGITIYNDGYTGEMQRSTEFWSGEADYGDVVYKTVYSEDYTRSYIKWYMRNNLDPGAYIYDDIFDDYFFQIGLTTQLISTDKVPIKTGIFGVGNKSEESVIHYSSVFGNGNTFNNAYSLIPYYFGTEQANFVKFGAAIYGIDNIVEGAACVFGRENNVTEGCTTVLGWNNNVSIQNALVMGYGLNAESGAQCIRLGFYNNEILDDIFEFGNGTGDSARSNLIRIDSDGKLYYNSTVPVAPIPISNGIYKLEVSGGNSSWVVDGMPGLPTADGDYKLHIQDGVATWVAIT